GIGKRCSLDVACQEHGIERVGSHLAGDDALDAARLLRTCLLTAPRSGKRTFADLAVGRHFAFVDSFALAPLAPRACPEPRQKSRLAARMRPQQRNRVRSYFAALTSALSDNLLTVDEIQELLALRIGLGLAVDEVRGVHTMVFAGAAYQFLTDQRI